MTKESIEKILISELRVQGFKKFTDDKVKIATSVIKRFGQRVPIIIDEQNRIVLGDILYYAAKKLNLEKVSVIKIENLSNKEIKAYTIAMNKIIKFGDFDVERLTIEVKELVFDESFKISSEELGFSSIEFDNLLYPRIEGTHILDDMPTKIEGITKPGDLIKLGQHFLYCGDALNSASYMAILGQDKADLVLTDPPYNVILGGHVTRQKHHKEFEEASGEMTQEEFIKFLYSSGRLLAENSRQNSIHYYFMDWRHVLELLTACNQVYPKQLNMCVWNKQNAGMGSFYRSQHELCFVFQNGEGKYTNNIQLGKEGRFRTNVWDYLGMSTSTKEAKELRKLHPTVKPTAMLVDILLDSSNYGDIVLDCFGGSGSTLIAAEECGRKSRLIEISPMYCDVIIARWETLTGKRHEIISRGEL